MKTLTLNKENPIDAEAARLSLSAHGIADLLKASKAPEFATKRHVLLDSLASLCNAVTCDSPAAAVIAKAHRVNAAVALLARDVAGGRVDA